MAKTHDAGTVDVLVVGAGPTGLALAAELAAFGVTLRIVDKQPDRVHESRALAIQPRTLEVLAPLGITDQLVSAGDPAVRLQFHLRNRSLSVPLAAEGVHDTAFPYLLFLSQAETERIVDEHLSARGIAVEREVELVALKQGEHDVVCFLSQDGRTSEIRARYVIGCDGAHSAVRHLCGIPFAGRSFPQSFLLADLEVDGLRRGRAHAYFAAAGPLLFFPLGRPATWRMIVMRDAGTEPGRAQLQSLVARHTRERLTLHEPVWATHFSVHSRYARRFRSGRAFLAGDAAHIHSPAGAQGMNTGIQDAVNLGWKLGLVCRGQAPVRLLDSYEAERRPVARSILRMTNRAFRVATARNAPAGFARSRIAPLLVRLVLGLPRLRAFGFRTVAQLRIRYRRSPLSTEGRPRLRRGPRAGDRLPDIPVLLDGERTTLYAQLARPVLHALLCGPGPWNATAAAFETDWSDAVQVLEVRDPRVLRALGVRGSGQYLVRPDGHVAYRAAGRELTGMERHLERMLRG